MTDPADPHAAPNELYALGFKAMFDMGIDPRDEDWPARDWSRLFPREMELLRVLSENPSTPWQLLAATARLLPLAVLRNPRFPEMWGHPDFPLAVPYPARVQVKLGKAGEKQLSLYSRPWLRLLLSQGAREAFALMERSLMFKLRMGEWLDDWVRARSTSGADLALLAQSPDPSLRRRVAGHGNLRADTAAKLMMDEDPLVRAKARRRRARVGAARATGGRG